VIGGCFALLALEIRTGRTLALVVFLLLLSLRRHIRFGESSSDESTKLRTIAPEGIDAAGTPAGEMDFLNIGKEANDGGTSEDCP